MGGTKPVESVDKELLDYVRPASLSRKSNLQFASHHTFHADNADPRNATEGSLDYPVLYRRSYDLAHCTKMMEPRNPEYGRVVKVS